MLALGNLLLLAGYTLVYAAVANGGAFASNPWDGLFGDAYQQPASNTPGGGGGSSNTPGGGGGSATGGLLGAIGSGNTGSILRDLTIGTPGEPLTPAWFWRIAAGGRPGSTIPARVRRGEANRVGTQGQATR